MKKLMITVVLLVFLLNVHAQEQFGKAIFTVPAGWSMTTSKDVVTLEKTSEKNNTCKIIISASKTVAVSTEAEHVQFRNRNSSKTVQHPKSNGAITKYEAEGLVCFFSKGTTTQKIKHYTYSQLLLYTE